jgi:mono/diheme cytochrome c family protein
VVFALVVGAALLLVACGGGEEEAAYVPPKTGPAIYKTFCATCHGQSGQGFVGPSLVDSAVKYPDVASEIAVVTNGRGEMPAWSGRLTPEQIATVVDYTRAEFATAPSVGPVSTTSTKPEVAGPPVVSTP